MDNKNVYKLVFTDNGHQWVFPLNEVKNARNIKIQWGGENNDIIFPDINTDELGYVIETIHGDVHWFTKNATVSFIRVKQSE